MPELPEVETTVRGLRETVVGLTISDIWSSYNSPYYKGKEEIKDPNYFSHFTKQIVGRKIISVDRRAKNILINLSGGLTILVHMKMTGHFLFGEYKFSKDHIGKGEWIPVGKSSLNDPFNRHIRFMITFKNGRHLALSDMRKFAKITLLDTKEAHNSLHLNDLGPEPLSKDFNIKKFSDCLDKRPNWNIKQALLDQTIISGIGNIYADESLWIAGIHPRRLVKKINAIERKDLLKAIKYVLKRGIDFGGTSTSDYRNIHGEKGEFSAKHNVYQKKGEKCRKKNCKGDIIRIVVAGRGTHLCDKHQK
jgi:formamidopyrimidine-DNA glycosylase